MAYPFITVCILIFLFYPVTPSQESSWRNPVSSHLRHSRHSQDVAREDGHGSGDEADRGYNVDMDQEEERMETDSSHQQLDIQDNSVLIPEKKSSREADEFDRTSPKDTQQRTGLSKAPVHQQSPFFSKVLSAAGIAPQKTRKKRRQKFSKKRSSRKQVNRPRWYFRLGHEHNEMEGEQKIAPQAKGSNRMRKNREEAEAMEEDEEEEEDSRRRGMVRKAVAGKGRRKARRQRKRPMVKECVECTETEARVAESRELHKRILVAQLLDKLRLEPRLTERPLPPKLPDQVFPEEPLQDHPGYQEDQYYAKPTQLLVFGQDLGKHRLRKLRTGSYKFELRNKVHGEVTNADLWVYKMPDAQDSHGQTLVVTQLHHSKAGRRLRERSLVTRLDTHVQEGWMRFDVTRLVRSWMEDDDMTSASSHMLAIRCKTCHRTSYRAIFGVKSNFRPVLVITEHRRPPEDSPRNKRSSQCDPTTRCCKFDLTVRFHDLGIHEIFYPKTIRTGYCFGTCERPDLHYHNHSMIMQRLRYSSYSPVDEALRDRVRPCCVPVVLREASVMHYVNNSQDTQVSLIPNLLVDRCGCA